MSEPAVYSLLPRLEYEGMDRRNSSLCKAVAGHTPAHGWNRFLSPNRPANRNVAALRQGTYFHQAVLEKPLWDTAQVTSSGTTTKAYAAELAKAEADGVLLVQEAEHKLINDMAAALLAHPTLGPLFEPTPEYLALNELTLTWQDPATGEECKARLDAVRVTDHGVTCLDLKTCVDASPSEFGRSAAKYLYTLQGAMYADALYYCSKPLEKLLSLPEGSLTGRPVTFQFVCVEKEAPHLIASYLLMDGQAAMGRELYRKALKLIREATISGEWAGYSLDPQPLQLPGWAIRQHDNLLYSDEQ